MLNMTKGESNLSEESPPPTRTSEDTTSMKGLDPELEPHEKIFFKKDRALDFGPDKDTELWAPASWPGPQG